MTATIALKHPTSGRYGMPFLSGSLKLSEMLYDLTYIDHVSGCSSSSHKSRFEHCTVVLLLLLLLLLVEGEERGKNSLAQPTMICGI